MSAELDPLIDQVIFSLIDERVWLTWPGTNMSLEIGHQDAVTYMMRDFLAQCEIGERLSKLKAGDV